MADPQAPSTDYAHLTVDPSNQQAADAAVSYQVECLGLLRSRLAAAGPGFTTALECLAACSVCCTMGFCLPFGGHDLSHLENSHNL